MAEGIVAGHFDGCVQCARLRAKVEQLRQARDEYQTQVARLREALEWAMAHIHYPDPDTTSMDMERWFQNKMNDAITALSDTEE